MELYEAIRRDARREELSIRALADSQDFGAVTREVPHFHAMEPVTTLSLVVFRFGARKVLDALLGKNAGDLADQLLGAMTQIEQSQARLRRIEDTLQVLVHERYESAQQVGARYLAQAVLPGRRPEDRTADLIAAEAALVQAAESAKSPMQRAHSERLLVLVRLARSDSAGAEQAWRSLDVCIGDAASEAFARFDSPYDVASQLIADGEFGKGSLLTQLNRAFAGDERWGRAIDRVKGEARLALTAVHGLLIDDVAISHLVGLATIPAPLPKLQGPLTGLNSLTAFTTPDPVALNDSYGRIVVDVPVHRQVSLGGVSCQLSGCTHVGAADTSGYRYLRLEATVALNVARKRPEVTWLGPGAPLVADEKAQRTYNGVEHTLVPGQRLKVSQEICRAPDMPLDRAYAMVGGLVFSAAIPPLT